MKKKKKFFASLPSPKNQPQIQKLQLLRLIFNFPQKVHFPCFTHSFAFIAFILFELGGAKKMISQCTFTFFVLLYRYRTFVAFSQAPHKIILIHYGF